MGWGSSVKRSQLPFTAVVPSLDTVPRNTECFIYALCEPNETDGVQRVRYVGMTRHALSARLRQHYADAARGGQTHRARWMRRLLSEGNKVTIELLEVVHRANRDNAEQWWIGFYGYGQVGSRLCNHSAGGGGPLNPTPETREKMSRAAVARLADINARARLSAIAKKQWRVPGAREKFSQLARDRWTHEERARQSEALKRTWEKPGSRVKLVEAIRRRMSTPEARERERQRMLGKKASPETRLKQSQSLIASWSLDPVRRSRNGQYSKDRWKDETFRAKTSAAIAVATSTPEHRARRSMVARRVFGTPEARERSRQFGLARRGIIASSQTREKLSAALKGKTCEDSRRAVLTWAQVREIRARSASGETRTSLSVSYQVSRATIFDVVENRRWREDADRA